MYTLKFNCKINVNLKELPKATIFKGVYMYQLDTKAGFVMV